MISFHQGKLRTVSPKVSRLIKVESIPAASVPIICLEVRTGAKPTRVELDLSFSCMGGGGSETTAFMRRYKERYPCFRGVALTLKAFLLQRGLNKTFTGGLGSYKMYVLLAHILDSKEMMHASTP